MNKLKYWRTERVLSQIELSIESEVGRWAIQLIEAGIRGPKEDELEKLSKALGVLPSDLLGKERSNG
jgi:transcriptional regulator with XRE-family HTH domain